jgi:nitrogen-specific signal transduction histidine kinase
MKEKAIGDGYEPTVSLSTKTECKVEIRVIDNGNGVRKNIRQGYQPFLPQTSGTERFGIIISLHIIKGHGR